MDKIAIAVAIVALLAIAAIGLFSFSGGKATTTTSVAASASTTVAIGGNGTKTTVPPTTSMLPNATNSTATHYTINLESSPTLGAYLANGSGFTLYTYTGDVQNGGTSACNGGCAGSWPPFYTATLVLPSGLNASAFGTITRSDGTKQLTYKGWPLYLFAGDSGAGQTNGQNVGGFVVATK